LNGIGIGDGLWDAYYQPDNVGLIGNFRLGNYLFKEAALNVSLNIANSKLK